MFECEEDSVDCSKPIHRKTTKIEEKLKILERMEKGESVYVLSREVGLSTGTLRRWKSEKFKMEKWVKDSDIRARNTQYISKNRSMKSTQNEDVDEATYIWYRQKMAEGRRVSGPMLQNKALSFNKLVGGKESFVASTGWLTRWKKRYGVRLPSINEYRHEYTKSRRNEKKQNVSDRDDS